MSNEREQTDSGEGNEIFGISAVSRLTGISDHVLRIWERRHRAVDPLRTDSRRRQYSREDIRRLTLLKTLTESGDSIGNLARLCPPRRSKTGCARPRPPGNACPCAKRKESTSHPAKSRGNRVDSRT